MTWYNYNMNDRRGYVYKQFENIAKKSLEKISVTSGIRIHDLSRTGAALKTTKLYERWY